MAIFFVKKEVLMANVHFGGWVLEKQQAKKIGKGTWDKKFTPDIMIERFGRYN